MSKKCNICGRFISYEDVNNGWAELMYENISLSSHMFKELNPYQQKYIVIATCTECFHPSESEKSTKPKDASTMSKEELADALDKKLDRIRAEKESAHDLDSKKEKVHPIQFAE